VVDRNEKEVEEIERPEEGTQLDVKVEASPVIEIQQEKKQPIRRSKFNKLPTLTKRERKKIGLKREGKAIARYIRMSSRKVELVLDLIRGKTIEEAYSVLAFTNKAASRAVFKVLHSAEANAVNNFSLDKDSLYVSEAFATQGPTLKRIMPRAQGRAYRIRKRTAHITIVVQEKKTFA